MFNGGFQKPKTTKLESSPDDAVIGTLDAVCVLNLRSTFCPHNERRTAEREKPAVRGGIHWRRAKIITSALRISQRFPRRFEVEPRRCRACKNYIEYFIWKFRHAHENPTSIMDDATAGILELVTKRSAVTLLYYEHFWWCFRWRTGGGKAHRSQGARSCLVGFKPTWFAKQSHLMCDPETPQIDPPEGSCHLSLMDSWQRWGHRDVGDSRFML